MALLQRVGIDKSLLMLNRQMEFRTEVLRLLFVVRFWLYVVRSQELLSFLKGRISALSCNVERVGLKTASSPVYYQWEKCPVYDPYNLPGLQPLH